MSVENQIIDLTTLLLKSKLQDELFSALVGFVISVFTTFLGFFLFSFRKKYRKSISKYIGIILASIGIIGDVGFLLLLLDKGIKLAQII